MRDDQRRRRLSRPDRSSRLPGGRQSEKRGRHYHRPHQYAGLQFSHRHRQRLARPDLQSMVEDAYAGRLVGRRRVVGCGRHHAAGARHTPRPLEPLSRLCLRQTRHPAFVRARSLVQPDAGGGAPAVVAADVSAGTAGEDGRRLASGPCRDVRARSARSVVGAGAAGRTGAAEADARRRRDRRRRPRRLEASSACRRRDRKGGALACRRRLRHRRRANAGLQPRPRAVVRDAAAGVSRVHAAADRKGGRSGHPHRGAVHAREPAVARRAAVHEGAGRARATGAGLDGIPRSRAAGARAGVVGAGIRAGLRR